MDTDELPDVMRVEHVQEHLDIGRKQAYEVANREDFPAFRPNSRAIRIQKDEYLKWLRQQSSESSRNQRSGSKVGK